MVTNKTPKNAMKFYCKCCDYGTGKRSEYSRHLLTAKHGMVTNGYKKTPEYCPYVCVCGKEYKHRQGLFRHKAKCNYVQDIVDEDAKEDIVVTHDQEGEDVDYKNMFMTLIKQKDSEIMTLVKQNSEIMKTITEMAPLIGSNNNNTNNFNINIFLNEKCKDAISMDKFIQGIEISMNNLLTTKDKGLTEGIS